MKHFSKKLALLLAVLACMSVLSAFVGCNGNDETESTDTESVSDSESTNVGTDQPGNKSTYTLTVQSAGGMKLKDVTVLVYADEALSDLAGYGSTNADGVATIEMDASGTYYAVLSGLPEGYKPAASYPLLGANTPITVTSSVIDNTDQSGVTYKVGDIMRDFQVIDTNGNTLRLSELLQEKKMVLINFWYVGCSWCVKEFPYMNASYETYKDQIEIVALNHYPSDSEAAVKEFKESYYETPLSFPMAKDFTGLQSAFEELSTVGYPVSVIVDRYGMICFLEAGAITSEEPFNALFEHFTAENYEQKIITSAEDLVERPKPDVEMPSSDEIAAVFNNAGCNATFAPETNESDAEYTWPFVITAKDGENCIASSNMGINSSFSTMYVTINLKKGEALAFDYFASSEQGADILYLLVKRNDINKDSYKDIYQISGEDSQWNTCYTYVANEDGEYAIAFCYIKDSSDSIGDDRVYLKNLRVVKETAIDLPTYIPRHAASDRTADGSGYNHYADVVFNETDGLYHVGSENGPLLLANLMSGTRFSDTGIYYFALDGKIVLNGKDYLQELIPYASYASNSALSGYCSVNQELKELLEVVAAAIGLEHDNPLQWLQMCSYYDAYGTNGVQLQDPTRGLYTSAEDDSAVIDPDRAFVATLGENTITYDRMIMPRGLLYKFVPETSGVYRVLSKSDIFVNGWIFDENGDEYCLYEGGDRLYTDENNVSMYVYMEAGKNYYIDICYYDVYQVGTILFDVSYIGESYDLFTIASSGYFTFPEDAESGDSLGELAKILAGGIDVKLGEDGYYHELREDGSLGSVLYADFIYTSSIFSTETLETLIEKGAFNFALSESDEYILDFKRVHGNDTKEYLKKYWGDQYETLAATHKVDEVLAGKMHGTGQDMTDAIKAYLSKKAPASEDHPELEGCVAVDEALGEILQSLMDKYTFSGVEHSWTKLAYYYQHIGA